MLGTACITTWLLVLSAVWRSDGSLIQQLIRENLAGSPDLSVVVPYEFDPDVAERLRPEFAALHGERGERLVERLGLGEDGYSQERRQKQRARDQQRLLHLAATAATAAATAAR